MDKNELRTRTYVNQKINAYKKFMGIKKLPSFDLFVVDSAVIQGDTTALAAHNYKVESNKHTLTVPNDMYLGEKEYILFHELTHLYDTATYSVKNKLRYFKNRGFTEYHAGQIELLNLLGAKTVEEKISFSLSQPVKNIFGETTILDYILINRDGVRDNVSKKTFPEGIGNEKIGDFSSNMGMFFNHLGRVSICRMYAEDYENFKEELEDFTFEKSFLGEPFERIIEIAQGFLTKEVIEEFADLFEQIAVTLFRKYKL